MFLLKCCRARRRRRYGRGPNKYDRTWEDEEAYSRPRGPPRGGGAPRGGGDSSGPSRGGSARFDRPRPLPQDGPPPREEDFPALANQAAVVEPTEVDPKSSSSPNWRENIRQENNQANAISFRRGGGGRTFEERNKSKMIKGRGEMDSRMTEMEPEVEIESPSRDNWKNNGHRGGYDHHRGGNDYHRGGGPVRGSHRGVAAYRGRRRDNMNWDKDHQEEYRGPHGVQGEQGGYSNETKGRGRGKFGRPMGDKNDAATIGLQQLHIDEQQSSSSNVSRSKRYSSQRQRMTTPPPDGAVVMPPYVPSASSAYYSSYNDSPPPNYAAASNYSEGAAPLGLQGAPPFIAPPIGYPSAAAPANFASGYQGYQAAAAPPVQVGVPISSPTQDLYGGGGIMYYDPGRQVNSFTNFPI